MRYGPIYVIVSAFCAFAVSFTVQGCATRSKMQGLDRKEVYLDEISSTEKTMLRQNICKELNEGLNRYRLSAGDVLEVMYHISLTTEAEDYVLGVSDEVSIEFFYQPQMNRTVKVRPDGKVTVPIHGDIHAAGLKPAELAENIAREFSDIFTDPRVTVTVNKYTSKIDDLKKAITNAPRGQAKTFPVSPDGYVYLPLLEGRKASGKTIDVLEKEINDEYRKQFNNLEISLLIESITANRAFIFGEVGSPGPIAMPKPMTVLQAVAMAGGALETGSLSKVKVLTWNERNEPELRTVNLQNVMHKMKIEEDFIVPNNSIIYVPMTTIAKLDQYVDQYIKKLFLYNGANLGFSYELHREPVKGADLESETQQNFFQYYR